MTFDPLVHGTVLPQVWSVLGETTWTSMQASHAQTHICQNVHNSEFMPVARHLSGHPDMRGHSPVLVRRQRTEHCRALRPQEEAETPRVQGHPDTAGHGGRGGGCKNLSVPISSPPGSPEQWFSPSVLPGPADDGELLRNTNRGHQAHRPRNSGWGPVTLWATRMPTQVPKALI